MKEFDLRPEISNCEEFDPRLLGREKAIRLLERHMVGPGNAKGKSTLVLGPEGSGKTALLQSYFNRTRRKQLAQKKILVVMESGLPANMGGDDLYLYYAGHVARALELVEEQTERERLLAALQKDPQKLKQATFETYLDVLHTMGYRVVMVMDNFERFTSGKQVKTEHHDLLRNFVEESKLQIIAATNYDLEKTSLSDEAAGSELRTRLAQNTPIRLSGLSAQACREMVETALRQELGEEDPFCLTDEQHLFLYRLSGGIPAVAYAAAEWFCQLGYDRAGGADPDAVRKKTMAELRPLLVRWCRVMTEPQLSELEVVCREAEYMPRTEGDDTPIGALEKRCIVQHPQWEDEDGGNHVEDWYQPCCELLRDFCTAAGWQDEARRANPRNKTEEQALTVQSAAAPVPSAGPWGTAAGYNPWTAPAGYASWGGSAAPAGNVVAVAAGATVNIIANQTNDNSQHLDQHVEHHTVTYHTKYLSVLNGSPDQLKANLEAQFRQNLSEDFDEKDEDQVAECISQMFVPAGAAQQPLPAEEQQELDDRFAQVRPKLDPAGLLTDELLASLSDACQRYLKTAFVVDERLSILEKFALCDMSPRQVMYGKAVEQHLRDCMFDLLHETDCLRKYDPKTHVENEASPNCFTRLRRELSMLGSYRHLVNDKRDALGQLCAQVAVCCDGQPADAVWWAQYGNRLQQAIKLRNPAAHAGGMAEKEDMDAMRQLLFGSGRLLQHGFVGRQLYTLLQGGSTPAQPQPAPAPQPASAPQPAAEPDYSAQKALEGTVVTLTDLILKRLRRNLIGSVQGTPWQATISPAVVTRLDLPDDLTGVTIRVRLIMWDANPTNLKFRAEPVE